MKKLAETLIRDACCSAVEAWNLLGVLHEGKADINCCRLLWITMSALWGGLVWPPVEVERQGKGFWRCNGRPRIAN